MYVLVHVKHTYIGRCDCLRKSKSWGGGPSHRFQEHVRCLIKHKHGNLSEKQRRTRYMLLAQSCNIICSMLIVFDKVHQSIAAATEITYINMFRPSCNNLQKTFGIKSHKEFSIHLHKLHKQVHSRSRNNIRIRVMSHFANSQNPVNLSPGLLNPEKMERCPSPMTLLMLVKKSLITILSEAGRCPYLVVSILREAGRCPFHPVCILREAGRCPSHMVNDLHRIHSINPLVPKLMPLNKSNYLLE